MVIFLPTNFSMHLRTLLVALYYVLPNTSIVTAVSQLTAPIPTKLYASDFIDGPKLVVNGKHLSIDQYTAGSSTQYALHTSFKLNYILRCPHASTNLLSVHKFTKNYVCCLELDANGSIVKDKNMGGPFSSGRLRTYCILSCCIP